MSDIQYILITNTRDAIYFEYDKDKSNANEEKHKVPLHFGSDIWKGAVYTISAKRKGEARKLSIGKIDGEHWSVIWEPRNGRIRLISVRLATMGERSLYDKHVD